MNKSIELKRQTLAKFRAVVKQSLSNHKKSIQSRSNHEFQRNRLLSRQLSRESSQLRLPLAPGTFSSQIAYLRQDEEFNDTIMETDEDVEVMLCDIMGFCVIQVYCT